MGEICLTLEQTLKKLNPHLILESRDFKEDCERERHRVRIWLDILPRGYLKRESSVESDVYNEGKLEIGMAPGDSEGGSFYAVLYEPAVTELMKDLR